MRGVHRRDNSKNWNPSSPTQYKFPRRIPRRRVAPVRKRDAFHQCNRFHRRQGLNRIEIYHRYVQGIKSFSLKAGGRKRERSRKAAPRPIGCIYIDYRYRADRVIDASCLPRMLSRFTKCPKLRRTRVRMAPPLARPLPYRND